MRICVVTPAYKFNIGGKENVSKLIKILEPLSDNIFVVTGEFKWTPNDKKVHIINIPLYEDKQIIMKVFKYIISQLKISWELLRIFLHVDIVFFYFGTSLLFPMLTAKIYRKKIILIATGSSSESVRLIYKGKGGFFFYFITRIIAKVNYTLADRIAVESERVINFLKLNKYRKKIYIAVAGYIDTDNFKIKKNLKDKRNLIGYIGRLSPEKGVLNFAKAIPLILKERGDLEFLIGGNGPLFDEIKNELKNNGSYDKVELTGWISRDELPKYLNELKLIVAPSYTEGGVPAVIMEAMACGTVSLVTPVAGVDVIKDGESGFILENNSPECIAKNVIRALEHPNLDEIVNNACNLVEEEFSYEKVVKQYRDMLYGLLYK